MRRELKVRTTDNNSRRTDHMESHEERIESRGQSALYQRYGALEESHEERIESASALARREPGR